MPKSRKFIDRKNAVTFHLVHRSQQDPLIADENAPQHVLVPASSGNKTKISDTSKRKEEQQKFGIFFDDDYDYLQHLRDVSQTTCDWEPIERTQNQTSKLKLPSSVFASEVEEDVGLLNKAAPHSGPRLDLDPDVVAAMDEDFDYEDPDNELEDNFIELANAEKSDNEENSDADVYTDDSFSEGNVSSEEDDDVASLCGPQYTFADEETKSHFTNYSMSSSVIRRNDQLSLLDDRFEQIFHKETVYYIGPLECEEIEGHLAPDSDMVLRYAKEMEEQQKNDRPILEPETGSHLKENGDVSQEFTDEENEDDELVPLEVADDPMERWDCESILSTYSNIYNRPKLIIEPAMPKKIRVSGRTGIPLGVLDRSTKLTAQALAKHNIADVTCKDDNDGTESVMSTLSILSIRPKDESPTERSERKKALKEYRKERRMEKKANTMAFKEEKKRQERVILNNKVNIQGIHLP
ncbi:hypothetical protein L9F63_009089 [Diploptera punctata]|uniref:Protein LTV1 homolog n=1 Tax=Diploptera punctata TaxID=6984 RepID=A0AAD7Z4G8_DIPPU|nr:hypothetical protein L9F63_009089 [Diploptera punctata]